MTTTYITGTRTTTATMNGSDHLFIQGRINGANLTNAVAATGNYNTILVEGTVSNAIGRGILIEGYSSTVMIAENGNVFQGSTNGGTAILLDGDSGGGHVVTNYGQIAG